jgi:hypothetical protein
MQVLGSEYGRLQLDGAQARLEPVGISAQRQRPQIRGALCKLLPHRRVAEKAVSIVLGIASQRGIGGTHHAAAQRDTRILGCRKSP